MKAKLITNKITSQIEELAEIIEQDVADLNLANLDNERVRNIKSLIESLNKITHTMLQLKKLDLDGDYEEARQLSEDAKIIEEYIKKRSVKNKNA